MMQRRWFSPLATVLVVAPFVGEVLSTATSVFVFLVVLPFHAALYGSGALLVREGVRRWRLGLAGLIALGAAYGILEEAEFVRSWFNVSYLPSEGDYSRVWDTSLLQAVHLTSFHAAVSIGCAIAITELLHPGHRDRPWASTRTLALAAVAMVLLFPLTLIEGSGFFATRWPQMAVALVLAGAVVALARQLPRTWPAVGTQSSAKPLARRAALALSAGFVLTYAAPPSGLPWPIAVLGAIMIPIVGVGAALRVLPSRRDQVLLGLVVGLLGPLVILNLVLLQPQTWLAAVLSICGLVGLRRLVARRATAARMVAPEARPSATG